MEAPIELVSTITEFNALSEELQDEDLDQALAFVVKLIAKPDVAPSAVGPLIVKLQALSVKFAILATYYMHFDKGRAGTAEAKKKNLYLTMAKHIDFLVNALKYIGKVN